MYFENISEDKPIKGIFSDSNVFMWLKSGDINKKVISKISLDSTFSFTSYALLCALALHHWLVY